MDTFKLVISAKDTHELCNDTLKDYKGACIALNLCQSVKSSLIHTDYAALLEHIRTDLGFEVAACIKDLTPSEAIDFILKHEFRTVILFGTYTSEYLQTLKNAVTDLELFVAQDPRSCSFDAFTSIYKDFCTAFVALAEPWRKDNYFFENSLLTIPLKDRCIVSVNSIEGIEDLKKLGFGGAFVDIKYIKNNQE